MRPQSKLIPKDMQYWTMRLSAPTYRMIFTIRELVSLTVFLQSC